MNDVGLLVELEANPARKERKHELIEADALSLRLCCELGVQVHGDAHVELAAVGHAVTVPRAVSECEKGSLHSGTTSGTILSMSNQPVTRTSDPEPHQRGDGSYRARCERCGWLDMARASRTEAAKMQHDHNHSGSHMATVRVVAS